MLMNMIFLNSIDSVFLFILICCSVCVLGLFELLASWMICTFLTPFESDNASTITNFIQRGIATLFQFDHHHYIQLFRLVLTLSNTDNFSCDITISKYANEHDILELNTIDSIFLFILICCSVCVLCSFELLASWMICTFLMPQLEDLGVV